MIQWTNCDAIHAAWLAKLQGRPDKPEGLTVEDMPILDLEGADLPYLGITMTEGDKANSKLASQTLADCRTCTINHEIWTKDSDAFAQAKAIRQWILKVVCEDETLGGLVEEATYEGFQTAPAYSKGWLSCTLLTLSFDYLWNPAS